MKGIKVHLRLKPISDKRHSLYLDFYPAIRHPKTGKPTRREFLGRYVYDNPKNSIEKQHNKDVLKWGDLIRLKRENNLNHEIYSEEKIAIDFAEWLWNNCSGSYMASRTWKELFYEFIIEQKK